ncbi:hypothetical protein GF1_06550 [Desulfolithobacter dissulfuricans]|uniref:Glycine zipper domain-containing protein n=1 Tax=Desulfolithobacter dissulfuricans TaxID=2795293 RepID=A0A915TYT1_9BACT|nr:glycine zipper domain-containing protein [Desulfolithobacter dissulfuricans]BCO08279.1 hypothetical protein GF1_06550 [Desulfolithobacter dissulfuricans]
MKNAKISASILIMLLLTSCTNMQVEDGKHGQVGSITGAIGGALVGQAIGRSTEATLIGAAVGTMLGYMIGNEMDKYDRARLNRALEYTPSGEPAAWTNPDTGNSYEVIPKPAWKDPEEEKVCREAEIIATIDGRTERTYTTACRDASGRWVLQN